MTVELLLTLAGTDTGPFNLYSDVDSYTTAFEVGVTKASLLAGYSTSLVPDYTSTIRVMSVNSSCNNYIDIVLSTTSTTTTAIPVGACISYEVIATTHFSVDVSYYNCDSELEEMVLPGHGSATFCAIEDTVNAVGPATITALGACTTTTTTTIGPLELAIMSATSDTDDACPLDLTEGCWIETSSPGVLTLGDRVYVDSGGTTYFVGDGDYWGINILSGGLTYSAQIDINGYITGLISICA